MIRRGLCVAALCTSLTGIAAAWGPVTIADREILPGTRNKFGVSENSNFEASYLNMPVFVLRGRREGPTLCLSAGIHGDEINGVEVARRVFAQTDAADLGGTLLVLPAINSEGLRVGRREMPDRRDLNRSFPGNEGGSAASIVANRVFTLLSEHCDSAIDLHTASNRRANLPQIRAAIEIPEIRDLAIHFGIGIVVNGDGPPGSLRRALANAGIPAIIYEAGEPLRFQSEEIDRGVDGVTNVMAFMGMIDAPETETPPQRIYERSEWIRAPVDGGGFFFPEISLGDAITAGQRLGRIVDPFTDEERALSSPIDGEIIGMAVPQPVLSGYALYHLAWHADLRPALP